MPNRIDHVTLGAASLEQGTAAMESALGVTLPRGGQHEAMSTHNCLAQVGNEAFLELIAVDPEAPPPGRIRWFTLDEPATRARLAERPRALCWVVSTDDLDALAARSPVPLGEILSMSRGGRSWRLTVPQDGSLAEAGLIPAFIEWSPGPHPSGGMQDLGLRLERVRLSHPDPDWLKGVLAALGIDGLAEVVAGARGLAFVLRTADGAAMLD